MTSPADHDSIRDILKRLQSEGVKIQDPARQQSDAEAAMAAYPYLRPCIGSLPAASQKFLKLDGTVQMFYQGNGYFVPLCIYLRDDHPTSPPVCIITPTAEMMIKPNHRHVDAQGVVYLPYLHEWNRKSNLVEMVQAVGAVFTADPFIFKKPRAAPGPPPYATAGLPVDLAAKTPVYAHKAPVSATPPRHPPPPPPAPSSKPATKEQYLAKTKQIEDMDSVLENSFRCPISMEIMQDPVFAADGHTYERCEIERWLQTKSTSPLTNEVLAHKMLTPNHNLRSQIRDYYSPVTGGASS